ncbi:hypothetical protein GE061_018153 [Apolygus lucorum]|uniref:Uncharacterized protein n=1 Tax=Apolygus lucorum TaxID=248454 RepID=A0A8S9XD38_APOLU|nr:hypothetical protein GE061_018153 [Apolygus lucorum]
MADEDHGNPTFEELTKEIEKLRENGSDRETGIKKLLNDTKKTQEHLKNLERQINNFQSYLVNNETGIEEQTGEFHGQVKSFIELTCECVVINKKMKYLRRLMKLNNHKLRDLENLTNNGRKEVKLSEDKSCQTDLDGEEEAATSTCGSQEPTSDGATSDSDTLMSEMFYLPTHPDLPDLRLFKLL